MHLNLPNSVWGRREKVLQRVARGEREGYWNFKQWYHWRIHSHIVAGLTNIKISEWNLISCDKWNIGGRTEIIREIYYTYPLYKLFNGGTIHRLDKMFNFLLYIFHLPPGIKSGSSYKDLFLSFLLVVLLVEE